VPRSFDRAGESFVALYKALGGWPAAGRNNSTGQASGPCGDCRCQTSDPGSAASVATRPPPGLRPDAMKEARAKTVSIHPQTILLGEDEQNLANQIKIELGRPGNHTFRLRLTFILAIDSLG
jgi:hypothetical protein